jgi:hypothetical protein
MSSDDDDYDLTTPEQELCYGISRGLDVTEILSDPYLKVNRKDHTYRRLGGTATALSQAAYQGCALETKLLLAFPSIKVNIRSRIGRTPLMLACEELCREGDYETVVDLLLAHPDIDIDARDDYGDTALKLAMKNGATTLADKIRAAKNKSQSESDE